MGTYIRVDGIESSIELHDLDSAKKIFSAARFACITLPDERMIIVSMDFKRNNPRNEKAMRFLYKNYKIKQIINNDVAICEPGEWKDAELRDYVSRTWMKERHNLDMVWLILLLIFLPMFLGWLFSYLINTAIYGNFYALLNPAILSIISSGIGGFFFLIYIITRDLSDRYGA